METRRWMTHGILVALLASVLIAGTPAGNFAQQRSLVIATTGDAESMDPILAAISTTSSVQQHVLESLVTYDPDGTIVSQLAVSWKALSPTVWEFKLRPNVKFHNGEPFDARAVKFSIERAATHPKSLSKAYVNLISDVRPIAPLTAQIITSKPAPDQLDNLASVPILPPQYAQEGGDEGLGRRAVGTGPYKFVEWVRDDRIVLERNEQYWGAKPDAVRVTIRPIPEGATRVAALLSGEVDVVEGIPIPDIPRVAKTKGLTVLRKPGPRLIFVAMDTFRERGGKHPDGSPGIPAGQPNPLKDFFFIDSFYFEIYTREIVGKVMEGHALPADQILAPFMFGYHPTVRGPLYDPSRAKRLLAEAGYPNGFEIVLDVPTDRYVNDKEVGLALVGMLQRVGIRATLNGMPRAIFFPKLRNFETTLEMSGWLTLVSSINYTALLGCSDPKTGYGRANYGRYCNAEMNRLIDVMNTEMDSQKRLGAFYKAAELNRQDVGKIPLYFEELVRGVKEGLQMPVRVDEWVLAQEVKFK
jgi:peptide/nickel transport system substrate-binding protein